MSCRIWERWSASFVLLLACAACGSDSAGLALGDGGEAPLCDSRKQSCTAPCKVSSDCDPTGGYACLRADGSVFATKSIAASRALLSLVDASVDRRPESDGSTPDGGRRDAGGAVDAGVTSDASGLDGAPAVRPDQHGYCALRCDTTLCVSSGDVCSSDDGFCRAGCDGARPACPDGRTCDHASRRCVWADGHCATKLDCGDFDQRLASFGDVACESQLCTFVPHPKPEAPPLPTATVLGPVSVAHPTAGERIDVASLASYRFRFDVPSPVMIAAILDHPPAGVDDASATAIWSTYVTAVGATSGVTLTQGNPANGAASLLVDPRSGTTLYFLVLGFSGGVLQAKSAGVPFSIGPPYSSAGDACTVPNDTLCNSDEPLVCVDHVCRSMCLSDADCLSESRSCALPGRNGISARVCL